MNKRLLSLTLLAVAIEVLAGDPLANDLVFEDDFDRLFSDCPQCPSMVVIPGGTFLQGAPENEPQSVPDEYPQRQVRVPTFAIGQTEVTFDQWDQCVADKGCSHDPDDEGWGRGDRPVIDVSWNDAQEFVEWLSNKTGHDYRLPTESEWEYAARAGTTGRFNTGDCISTDQANFDGTNPAAGCPVGVDREQTLPVGTFAPNAFGLYDAHGNVYEYVQDRYSPNYIGAPTDGSAWISTGRSTYVVRDGSWRFAGQFSRSANRLALGVNSDERAVDRGFRVARDVETGFRDCSACPLMVMIPAGTYTQGSPESEPESGSSERPQRQVTLQAFAIGQTEVTFEQWDACVLDGGCTHNPSDEGWGRGDRPVINVSWNDAQEYVVWLSARSGEDYRLPSESEWEYAARAGSTERFNTGGCITTDQANFDGRDPAQGCPEGVNRDQTLPVASFYPNAFGLFDAHGNVLEWTQDCWNLNYEGAPNNGSAWLTGDCDRAVVRSGFWLADGRFVRVARRSFLPRGARLDGAGFRVARVVDP